MFGTPFYHRTLRKMVTLFGNLFNNLYIIREKLDGTKKEYIKVAISYANKEKFVTRLRSDPDMTKSIATTLPRMSFEMTGITYDPTRKQQSMIRYSAPSDVKERPKSQYIGIPYTFNFSLSLYARNIEDGAMIVEQILPYFQPDFTVTATLIEEMDIKKDIPFVLESVQETIDYEGTLASGPRMVTWDLTFSAKGWIFGPIANTGIIMGVQTGNTIGGGITTNMYLDRQYAKIQKIKVSANGFADYNYEEGEYVFVDARHISGKVLKWSNTNNELILTDTTATFAVGDELRGVNTNTRRIANSVFSSPQLLSEIKIVQDPIAAGPDDAYGYTTTITEYPDTL